MMHGTTNIKSTILLHQSYSIRYKFTTSIRYNLNITVINYD